ncbi:MAG TPA: DUF4328 domain-containing protein [Polyangia bacterium]|nr:DUF4328 domain-containing protein [Polyangia bacterium]
MEEHPLNPYTAPAAVLEGGTGARAPASGGYRPLYGRANAVTIFLGLTILLEVLTVITAGASIWALGRALAHEPVARDTLIAIDDGAAFLTKAHFAVFAAVVVSFCMLTHMAGSNAHSFGQMRMEFTPGWAVGFYFIPFVALWKPYQAMQEIWRASEPNTKESFVLERAPVPGLLPGWWATFLGHNLIARFTWTGRDAHDAQSLIQVNYVVIVSSLATIVASIVAIALVRALARRQDECQKAAEAFRSAQRAAAPAG